jgi:formate hydrogenlyase transcriptional activator
VYIVDRTREILTSVSCAPQGFRWTVMSGTVQRATETALTERYEALLRVSQTLISIRSSEELFSILARELRAVVNFYVMGVGIYDEKAHQMTTKSYGEPGVPLQAPKFAPEETFSWWVYQHQRPLIIPSLDSETRFPAVAEMLKSRGVRSVCVLPLTTVHRRLGGLAVGSIEVDAYSSEEVSFLSLVGNQVALAVDDALNFDASQHAKEALRASEASFRLIVDSIPAFAWYAGPDGKIEYLNQRILDYTGGRMEDLAGFGWANVLHPQDVEGTKKAWLHSVGTGEPCDVEQRVRRFDNVYRWFRTTALPLRDQSGRVIRWYGVALDIEDGKRVEEALRASELNLRQVVDSIPGLVCSMNAAGEFQHFNRQMLEYFGKPSEELKSWATSDVIHPDDLPRVMAAFRSSIETGHPYDMEHRCRRATGVYRWFQVRALPLRDGEGHVISWYVLLTDIEKRKQAEDRLQLLLDVTNQVVSNLQLRDLLRAISGNIRQVMQCDCASLALPDAENKQLQLNVLDFPEGQGFFHEEGVYSINGSPYGTAFQTMKPLALETPFATWLDNPVVQSRISEGFKSSCFIPLMRRNRAIGTLNLGRLRGDAFSEEDLYFLSQVANQIAIAVENALEYRQIAEAKERLVEQKVYLEDEIRHEHNFEEIIGNSPRLKAVLESVRIVAPADSTVLIQGETGTGKEIVARAIHNLSSRRGQAFVKVNCAAIPLGLLESELFGHEKGSFTGAIARRIGRFELADRGTLFLDEVSDIPLELQPKLLRVLQEQEFERLGGTRTQRVDVRVLAATNASLAQMVAEKKFRSDLYYRLNVFPIDVPPLRERCDDIPVLVRYFANKYARRMGKQIESIPNETMYALSRYSWPGNIRELQNLMERAALLSPGPSLRVPLAEILTDPGLSAVSGGNALEQAEREQIVRALRETNWVVGGARGAAVRLGLKRTTLAYKMQKLGISRLPQ